MARTPRVAIIGGGIAGLAAALALHRRGVEYLSRRVLYPDGTAHRVAWLYGYDVAAEEHYA